MMMKACSCDNERLLFSDVTQISASCVCVHSGQQLASQIQQQNPDLVQQLRSQLQRPPGEEGGSMSFFAEFKGGGGGRDHATLG